MENQTCSSSYASSSYVSERRKEWEERRRQMKEQETEKIELIKDFLKTHPPSRIEEELNEYIIDQPSLTKNVALFYDLCKHRKWHKIQNGNRAGKAQGGLLPIIAY